MVRKSDLKIVVEKCDDGSEWLWEVLDKHNGVRCDGWATTEASAYRMAERAREDELTWLNEVS